MSELKVAISPLSGDIYAGTVIKGRLWGKNKTNVTMDAICAVAEHGLKFGEPIVVSDGDGNDIYKITVEKLNNQ
tara:strand:+ start:727 stop:948 length:222 start_codon:yes stop_codon:yes gene_type:complete